MSGALDKAVAGKEGHSARRAAARTLLKLAAALRKAARRVDPAGGAAAGWSPDTVDLRSAQPRGLTAHPVFWALVRKDLYASRLLILATFVTAAAGLALQKMGGDVAAAVLLYCAGAAPAAFLCLMLISGERQERSHLFALSLPISPPRYLLAKVVAVTAAFAVPWGLLGAGIGVLLMISQGATQVPYVTVVWLFVVDLFCGLLWVVVASRSAALVVTAMILFNVTPSLYFNYVARWTVPPPGAVVLWSPYALRVVTIEAVAAAVCFAFTLWCVSRQKDQT